MPGCRLAGLGRSPCDAAPFDELDHVVFPNAAVGEGHGEYVADGADPLPGRRLGQVVVAVPPGLPRRVGDELEDRFRRRRDLAVDADDPSGYRVVSHRTIQTDDRP